MILVVGSLNIDLEERKRLSAKANAKRAHLETRLGELNREIERLVTR
jgi:hypothetical protein